jgi:uncharacterized protein DUF4154
MYEAAATGATSARSAAAAALAVLSALMPRPAAAVTNEIEYQVKAEFVERFTHFVDWPPAAFPGPDAPFVICVIGDTPVTAYLQRMASGRRIKDRRVELRRLRPDADLRGCQVVFIAADERNHLAKIITAVGGLPILTVADSEGFGRAGVLINMVVDDDGRVRFDISSSVARRTALTLNAQLLKLSRHAPEDD